MNTLKHLGRRSIVPVTAYLVTSTNFLNDLQDEKTKFIAYCDGDILIKSPTINTTTNVNNNESPNITTSTPLAVKNDYQVPKVVDSAHKNDEFYGSDETVSYHGLFPKRQLWKPRLEYPLWDNDWDSRKEQTTGDDNKDKVNLRRIRKDGVTRHIILVRHGQYDETYKEDDKRILTKLGREQADITGKRLAELVRGLDDKFGPCNIKSIRVSNMARAKETAKIISNHLTDVEFADPDPLLNEGRPSHNIPGGRASSSTIQSVDDGHARIEKAFTKYFFRADSPSMCSVKNETEESKDDAKNLKEPPKEEDNAMNETLGENKNLKPHPKHEFEIIVCHANVIRYFTCRALQIPPEAWLRLCIFNCSLTYLTIRPTGNVSCRMLGDIGHLDYGHSTFSNHHGFNW